MKMRQLSLALLACGVSFGTFAQEPKVKTSANGNQKTKWADGQKIKTQHNGEQKIKWDNGEKIEIKIAPPGWAVAHGYNLSTHAYFPDYYTFYDPTRGYVYWENGDWIYSLNPPSFLNNVNLESARLQTLNDLKLGDIPERHYPMYSHQYPAQPVNITVPVPVIDTLK